MSNDYRPLPQIAEQERRENQREPCDPDGPPPEMAHVGVERLAARDREDDAAENSKSREVILNEEPNGMMRREGAEDLGVPCDVDHTEKRDRRKPEDHHG